MIILVNGRGNLDNDGTCETIMETEILVRNGFWTVTSNWVAYY